MLHNIETITRKIQMNATLVPAEMVMLMRDMLLRIENMESVINGLEDAPKNRSRTGAISKGKVSKPEV